MGKDKSIEEFQEENTRLKANLKTAFRELGQRNDQLNEKHKEVRDSRFPCSQLRVPFTIN